MLTTKGTPPYLDALYREYKELAAKIYRCIQDRSACEDISAETDMLDLAGKRSAFVFIREGFYKLQHRDKVIRLYSDGDFISPYILFSDEWSLKSEFKTHAALIGEEALVDGLARSQECALPDWTRLLALENTISLGLCSIYLKEDARADFQFKEYEPDDVIIEQGDTSEDVFEMVSGAATVLRDDTEVGSVQEGEFFGEISFLTGHPRTATVKAAKKCFVRIINKDDITNLVTQNPDLILAISRGLASRITQLNKKVT